VRTGGVETLSSETQAIKTIGAFTALELLNLQRDKDMLLRLIEIAAFAVHWTWLIGRESWHSRWSTSIPMRPVQGRTRRVRSVAGEDGLTGYR
jgi:hypothetical protein